MSDFVSIAIDLGKLVLKEIETIRNYTTEVDKLSRMLSVVIPSLLATGKFKEELDHNSLEIKVLTDKIKEGKTLVEKCIAVKGRLDKRHKYTKRLTEYVQSLADVLQIDGQAMMLRDVAENLVFGRDTNFVVRHVDATTRETNDIAHKTLAYVIAMQGKKGSFSDGLERGKYGLLPPAIPSGTLTLVDGRLEKLVTEVVADDRSVLAITGPTGCGKTALVKQLCHHPEIREIFGENIFYVTASETPNLQGIVSYLFKPDLSGPQLEFESDEDATIKLADFLNAYESVPMLLVLDGVWSASFIEKMFPSKIRGHKIVVTSQIAFRNYKVFPVKLLNDEDAETLLRASAAFTEGGNGSSPIIDNDLVKQMVSACKNHPKTLCEVGRSLIGKDQSFWKSKLKKLSQGRLVLDLYPELLKGPKRSFKSLDDDLKECFLDFSLFPEDQSILVGALSDIWAHLRDHDDDDTKATISELSDRNLANIMTTRSHPGTIVNYSNQQFVAQHGHIREFAVYKNNEPPLAKRRRLIINAPGENLPTCVHQPVDKPMQAQILSISTGESFSSKWCNMEVPDLEVLMLYMKSKTYTLPPFLDKSQKLKILNIINHGLYPTQFTNFRYLTSSHNLTRVRLEHVELSPSILSLINLQKVSLVMCKIGDSLKERITGTQKFWPQLVEIEIDYCQDLLEFPGTLCNSDHLKKISITNCNELCGFSEEIGDFNLETLTLRSCTKLEKLPDSICRQENLSVLDISDCLSLSGLPRKMGKLGSLRRIILNGCTGINELPESVEELSNVNVVCDEEISYYWQEYSNIKIDLVEEDRLGTLMKIIGY